MINKDFTLTKYEKLCKAIIDSKYVSLTVNEYLTRNYCEKCIIMRHDVDRKPDRALEMAQIEHYFGINSTYYFRTTKEGFIPDIIKQIASLGHEIGYHYEVLDKAKGDINKAMILFEQELLQFRKIAHVTTICMHGNPLTTLSNRDMWKECDFKDFGIIGEAYLSLDFNKVYYLTDTGRRWNDFRYSVKDNVLTNVHNFDDRKIKSTDNVIDFIKSERFVQFCLLTHPARWNNNLTGWLNELIWQKIKNVGKRGIVYYRNNMIIKT